VGRIGAKPACKDTQAALEHRAEKWVPVFGKKMRQQGITASSLIQKSGSML
jgi:hypothetical protein